MPAWQDRPAALLALMALLVPALGVPSELMLQDTFKSAAVAFLTLGAALAFFWAQRREAAPVHWHAVLWLPLALLAWALGSMAWSHAFLGGVEAVRWTLFTLLAWLAMQLLTPQRLPWLALGVHAGTVACSLWAALQFWLDWRFFPQGPNPASTFVNRNFFAEYAVSALPFSWLLLAQARRPAAIAAMAASTGLVVVAIGMTGTRAALMALWLQVLVVLPLLVWRCRRQVALAGWDGRRRAIAAGVLLATIAVLGAIPTGNARIAEEGRGLTPAARALVRTQSIRPDDPSLGLRMQMWQATGRMVAAHPLAGVGAGAWEVQVPRFQAGGAQLETDYYVHNEFLQLVAEYGLVGWAVLAGLLAWLLRVAAATLRDRAPAAQAEAPWRATALASLLVLMVVSQVGFAWRLAATGALFALCLGLLAGSQARLAAPRRLEAWPIQGWSAQAARLGVILSAGALVVAAIITARAAEVERKLVEAARIALTITASGRPQDPAWGPARAQMLRQVEEAVALNPHYRKLTPMVADELARWGDWSNATWIWESVLASRPYVVALLTNAARGHANLGDDAGARAYLARALAVQPDAPSVRSLEVVLLARGGDEAGALARARDAVARGAADADMVLAAFVLARQAGDDALAARARDLATPQQRAWMDQQR
ncbi:O-antigen ligase family protein [Ramlibacter sp. MAHUQ-53]|uniref:O-antigen ligase family protein n=1 Tax=unclassified Ramlibacter TaxID=2617605 RepID=UPI00366AEFF2